MTPDDMEQLRRLALAATPGPWCWEAHGEKSNDWTVGYAEDDAGNPLTGEIHEPNNIVETVGYSEPAILRQRVVIEKENATGYADAAFIAAANPARVIELLDRVARAEEWAAEQVIDEKKARQAAEARVRVLEGALREARERFVFRGNPADGPPVIYEHEARGVLDEIIKRAALTGSATEET